MKPNQDTKKHQKKIQNKAGQETLPRAKVIETLKEEILHECREVARGAKVSIYEQIEKTKELMALEAEIEAEQNQAVKKEDIKKDEF